MSKARKQFVIYAVISVFVLLTVLLGVINFVNFAMIAEDADEITSILSEKQGSFMTDDRSKTGNGNFPGFIPGEQSSGAPGEPAETTEATETAETEDDTGSTQPDQSGNTNPADNGQKRGMFENMGPGSPELNESTRYFTYAFDSSGHSKKIAFAISAVSEDEASEWAESLLNSPEVGWTRTSYRYRIYSSEGQTYVTVIDQGRELLPAYRIMIISIIGGALLVLISFAILTMVSKKLFRPLEEADRKQKQFISDVERDFKVPLTVINADTEIIEREHGPDDYTVSIHRQVRQMTTLVKNLGYLAVSERSDELKTKVNLTDMFNELLDSHSEEFRSRNIEVEANIANDVSISGNNNDIYRMINEVITNAVKFARSKVRFSLGFEDERVRIVASNDTELYESAEVEQVFNRFTRLDNAQNIPGAGLGLSYVNEIVKAHNGRVNASLNENEFIISIKL